MSDHTAFVILVTWSSIMFVIAMYGIIRVFIELRKDDMENAGRIDEKSIKTLKDQLKKSKAIDRQQGDRIGLFGRIIIPTPTEENIRGITA